MNRNEVQAQLGIADPEGHEEQIEDACLNIREKWLYAWFREKFPDLAEQLLRTLVIVHDEFGEFVSIFPVVNRRR